MKSKSIQYGNNSSSDKEDLCSPISLAVVKKKRNKYERMDRSDN